MSVFSIIPRFPLGGKMGECSLYETATQEVITMYNDEFNNNDMYRFTNREVPRDDYAPAPRQENTYTAPVKKPDLCAGTAGTFSCRGAGA